MSSLKSRSPRVASTGWDSLPPNPRRSTAITRRFLGSTSMISCQNNAEETLPCTNTTVWCGGVPGSSPARSRICVASRDVVTMRDEMPSNSVVPEVLIAAPAIRDAATMPRAEHDSNVRRVECDMLSGRVPVGRAHRSVHMSQLWRVRMPWTHPSWTSRVRAPQLWRVLMLLTRHFWDKAGAGVSDPDRRSARCRCSCRTR